MQIRSILTRFEVIDFKFEAFEEHSTNLLRIGTIQEILTIRMQIRTIRTRFKAIECKFDAFEQDSTNLLQIRTIRKRF